MTARPIACGRFRDDGTLEVWRGYRLSTVLLSEQAIAEALEDGWMLNNGWRDELHDVVLAEDAHSELMATLVASAEERAR